MDEKIKRLLGRGLQQAVVASAVGCSESYVSQLMAREDFAAAVNELRVAFLEADGNREERMASIEDKITEKLEKAIPYMMKPQELLNAYKVINGRKRGTESSLAVAPMQQVVQVNLPVFIQHNFLSNKNNEIVEVAGRSMATLTPASLKHMLADRQEKLETLKGDINHDHERIKTISTEEAKRAAEDNIPQAAAA